MDWINMLKGWIGSLTELALMLLALAIVLSLLVSPTLPFFGDVAKNIMGFVKGLGDGGLIGLITLGFIIWLFSKRQMA
jgi:hypothetical protein